MGYSYSAIAMKQGATAVVILLAAVVALLGLYAAIVGNPSRHLEQIVTQEGKTITIDSMFQYHYIAGFFYTLAAGMIVGGLLHGKLRIAWYGLAFLFVISVLFVFSSGAALLPVVAALFILLIIIQRN